MLCARAIGCVLGNRSPIGDGAALCLEGLTGVNVYDFVQAITDLLKRKHLSLAIVCVINLETRQVVRRATVNIHDKLRVKRALYSESRVGFNG